MRFKASYHRTIDDSTPGLTVHTIAYPGYMDLFGYSPLTAPEEVGVITEAADNAGAVHTDGTDLGPHPDYDTAFAALVKYDQAKHR